MNKKRIFNGHVAVITLLCLFFTWDETKDFITEVFSFSGVIVMNVVLTLSALISVYIFVRKSIREKEIDLSCVALLGLCLLFLVVENSSDAEDKDAPAARIENSADSVSKTSSDSTLILYSQENWKNKDR